MQRSASSGRTSRSVRRGSMVVVLAFALTVLGLAPQPAQAAGLNLPVQMGQRFINSPSAPKPLALPLAATIGPIRSLANAGIQATTFPAVKDPILGITILSSGDVKQIVLDTIAGLSDDTTLAFKVNALEHADPTNFTLGGNCVGTDGATTPICVATVTFDPKSAGPKTDPINVQITITKGLSEIEDSLHLALAKHGVIGAVINLAYPLIKGYVQGMLTDGIEGAMLAPVATATGTGVAGPFTDPTVFIKRQYADFAAGAPTSAQISTWIKNFEGGGAPAAFIDSLRKGSAWDGRVGPVSRLYSAYFLRAPDTGGLKFWVNRSRGGQRLYAISSTFAASSEFTRRYGKLSNADFVKLVYRNVLGRSPDASGLAYWTRQMTNGKTRGRLMVGFSESSEYVRKQASSTTTTEIWFGMLHRAPTPAELTGYSARLKGGTAATTIINEVMAGTEYRSVVLG